MTHSVPRPLPTPGDSGGGLRWWHYLGLASLSAAVLLLFFHRPEGQFFFPRCSFHGLTGLHCPGCGGLRAAHHLLHGEFSAALRSNALLVVGLLAVPTWWLWRRRQPAPRTLGVRAIWWLFAVVMLFTIARNLPWLPFHWLAP